MRSAAPMASAAAKPRPARPRGTSRGAPRAGGAARWWRARWFNVALLVALVTLGLPLAHALFGEVVALLGGAAILGFLLGRWTA